MAFFPKEEVVRRRGVAMHVRVVDESKLNLGPHRDKLMDKAATAFAQKEFVLNKAMDASPPCVSKVRTFRGEDAPIACEGNGNILAPTPEVSVPKTRRRPDLSEVQLAKLHDERVARRKMMDAQIHFEEPHQNGRGFYDKFSLQPQEKLRRSRRLMEPVDDREIVGFKGLGANSADPVIGRAHVGAKTYNPLNYRPFPFPFNAPDRPERIHLSTPPKHTSIEPCFVHNDGVSLEQMQKKEVRYPHIHPDPPVRYPSPQFDIKGFPKLGASDFPSHQHRRKPVPAPGKPQAVSPPNSKILQRRDTTTGYFYPDISELQQHSRADSVTNDSHAFAFGHGDPRSHSSLM